MTIFLSFLLAAGLRAGPAAAADMTKPPIDEYAISEDYGAFIASEAAARAAHPRPPLEQALGIADLLASRASTHLRVIVTSETVHAGLREQALEMRSPLSRFVGRSLSPMTPGPHPAVVLLSRPGGGMTDFRDPLAEGLAGQGFLVLQLKLTTASDRQSAFNAAFNLLLVGRTLTGCHAFESLLAFDYLRRRPDVQKDRIAFVGQGTSAMAAWMAAALEPRISALAVDMRLRELPEFDFEPEILVPSLLRQFPLEPGPPTWVTRADDFPHADRLASWLAEPKLMPAVDGFPGALLTRLFEAQKDGPPSASYELDTMMAVSSFTAQGRLEEAVRALERLAAKYPSHMVYERLAKAQEALGRGGDALRTLDSLFLSATNVQEQSRAKSLKAAFFRRQRQPGRAEESCCEALRLDLLR